MKLHITKPIRIIYILIVAICLSACAGVKEHSALPNEFKKVEQAQQVPLSSKEDLAQLEEVESPVFMIGKGDVLKLDVMGRPEVSSKMIVGPDGQVSVPLLGILKIEENTREAAQSNIQRGLAKYYTRPVVTLSVEDYVSSYVTVMGRVQNAGMQRFNHPPTLIEVLASSGAMPVMDKQASLTKAAIMRGRDKVIWVNLKALMQGDIAYNMRLKNGDVIYVPDSADSSVYILGLVKSPGSYRLTPRMSVLDAISQAGGLTEDANGDEISIYRPGTNEVQTFSFKELINTNRKFNFAMEDGDVIYIPRSGMGGFGYVMRQISPALNVLSLGLAAAALAK